MNLWNKDGNKPGRKRGGFIKRGGFTDKTLLAFAERSREKAADKRRWEKEREEIRVEEEKRAIHLFDDNKRKSIRSSERSRAERKAGVTSLLDSFTPNLDVNNSKQRGGRNNTTSNNRRIDFFNASGADETNFSGSSSSGTPKGKQKKVSKNKLDYFRIFDEL